MPRILVAGIGNVFLGDDGFGVEVALRLRAEPTGPEIVVTDFGIRGVHLAFELTSGKYDAAILIDALSRGGAPGTLHVIEPSIDCDAAVSVDAHGLTPAAVLALARRLGGGCPRITIVGCEPESVEESAALTPAVAAAVDEAARLVVRLATGTLATLQAEAAACA